MGGGVQFDRFLQKIKPVGKYQGEETVKIADHLNGRLKGQTKYRLIGGWVKDRVRQITPAGTEECFDLTIPQAHCFQANGLIAHNSLEQDADVVAFIFREEQYLTPSERDALPEERKNVAEIIIGKQRSGPTGTVDLRFTPSSMRFDNLYRETTPALDYGDRE